MLLQINKEKSWNGSSDSVSAETEEENGLYTCQFLQEWGWECYADRRLGSFWRCWRTPSDARPGAVEVKSFYFHVMIGKNRLSNHLMFLTSFRGLPSESLAEYWIRNCTTWLKRSLTEGSGSSMRSVRERRTAWESLLSPVRFTCWQRWGRASKKAEMAKYKASKSSFNY